MLFASGTYANTGSTARRSPSLPTSKEREAREREGNTLLPLLAAVPSTCLLLSRRVVRAL